MIDKFNEYRKAVAAFLTPALLALGVALADGTVSAQEWITIAIAALGTSIVVGAVGNKVPVSNKTPIK